MAAPARVERLGRETPRLFTKPLRRLTRKTSAGYECITFAEEILGLRLLPWQRWVLIHALELLPDGTYRFRTVVLLVARQNGKSTLLVILALWRMFVDGAPLVIGTAQNLDVAEEQWEVAVDLVESLPELAAEVAHVTRTNGKKALRLETGERYKVAAASRRGGRGLSGDLVILDELREHQSWEAWGAVTKTTMARSLAQIWAASNAGDNTSIVLAYLRLLAHLALGNPDGLPTFEASSRPDDEEEEDSLGLFEWSAPPGCDVWDRDAWAQANPSLGHAREYGFGITERAIASAARTDPEEVFRTEVLCQWVEVIKFDSVLPAAAWALHLNATVRPTGPIAYAIDASPDLLSAAIGASDGTVVRVLEHGPGVAWLPTMLRSILDANPGEVWLDPKGPISALIVDLAELGIEWREVTPQEHAQACGGLLAAALADPASAGLWHAGQPVLEEAVVGATRRPYGDAWAWNRRTAKVDISPLVTVTLARWAALQPAEPSPRGFAIVMGGNG